MRKQYEDRETQRNRILFITALVIALTLIAAVTMMAFYFGNPTQTPKLASTMAFATLTLARLFHGFNCRSKQSIFRIGLLSNKYSVAAFFAGVLLLVGVLFIPVVQSWFAVEPISLTYFCCIVVLAFGPTAIIQIDRGYNELTRGNS